MREPPLCLGPGPQVLEWILASLEVENIYINACRL